MIQHVVVHVQTLMSTTESMCIRNPGASSTRSVAYKLATTSCSTTSRGTPDDQTPSESNGFTRGWTMEWFKFVLSGSKARLVPTLRLILAITQFKNGQCLWCRPMALAFG